MKANELRIGNYVSDIHAVGTFYAEVKKLDFSRCYYGKFNSDYSDLKPIPLTEEWLFKFGFEITKQTKEDNNIWTFKGSECKFELEQIIKFHLYDNMHFGTEIKHVHQLQNLYFALTGEELTFKSE